MYPGLTIPALSMKIDPGIFRPDILPEKGREREKKARHIYRRIDSFKILRGGGGWGGERERERESACVRERERERERERTWEREGGMERHSQKIYIEKGLRVIVTIPKDDKMIVICEVFNNKTKQIGFKNIDRSQNLKRQRVVPVTFPEIVT